MFGRITVHARDIQTIEVNKCSKYRIGEGRPGWTMGISHTGGKIEIGPFRLAREFLYDLKIVNSTMTIIGEEWIDR